MSAGLSLSARLARIQFLLCDVDGVLTDGTILITPTSEVKRFSIQDGLAMRLLQQSGVKVGWVSARPSPVTTRRWKELKLDFLHQAAGSKVAAIQGLLAKEALTWSQVCFVGDDVVDLGAMKRAGAAVAVANAIPEVKSIAHWVTRSEGGKGAVREVAVRILTAQKKWLPLVKKFSEL